MTEIKISFDVSKEDYAEYTDIIDTFMEDMGMLGIEVLVIEKEKEDD